MRTSVQCVKNKNWDELESFWAGVQQGGCFQEPFLPDVGQQTWQAYFLEDPNYSATAGMDAVLKCSRFANVGNAAGHLEPHASMFFNNAVENQVQEVDEQGRRVAV